MIEQEPVKAASLHKEPFSTTQQQFTRGVEILYERGREVLTSLPIDHKPKLRSESAMANIARLHLFSPLNYREIAKLYGITRKTARKYAREGIKQILIQSGITDEENAKIFNLRKPPPRAEKKVLPKKTPRPVEMLRLLDNPETPCEVSRELIKEVSYGDYRANPNVFCGIRNAAIDADLFPSTRNNDSERIATFLEQHGIPIHHLLGEVKTGKQKGIKHYWITLECTREKAVKLLKNAPEFEEMRNNPVRVIGDFEGKPPTKYSIQKKDSPYRGLGSLLRTSGIQNTNLLFGKICQIFATEELSFPRFIIARSHQIFYMQEHEALAEDFVTQQIRKLRGESV